MELIVEYLPLDKLVPYERNSRTHTDEQIQAVAASIREFSFTNPVLVDADNGIIAGHCRAAAARLVGLERVPCIRLAHLTEAQRRALVIADNQLAIHSGAGWNAETLALELGDLAGGGFDLGLLGFSGDELADLLADRTSGLTDPDDAPEPPVNPVSVPGDVWIMGRHRIVCGDSTDADTVARALNGVTPHLMVTDPPYGVEYDADWRNKAVMVKGERPGHHGSRAVGKVLNDGRADWSEAWALFPGDVVYVWHAGLFAGVVADSLTGCGFDLRSQIIWAKSNFAIGRGDYHWHHEPCWYAVRKGKVGHYGGDRKQTTLWQIPKPQRSETGHSTQKPVECMRRPIENNSSAGQAVYEPFSGSGTTIIAGEMTGRSVHAIELNPAYVDVAVKRWQSFVGADAMLEGDGRTFEQVCEQRFAADAARNGRECYDDAVEAAHEALKAAE